MMKGTSSVLYVVASSVVSFVSFTSRSLLFNRIQLFKIVNYSSILVSILELYSRLSPAVLWLTELQVSEKVHVWFRISGDILNWHLLRDCPCQLCVSIDTSMQLVCLLTSFMMSACFSDVTCICDVMSHF